MATRITRARTKEQAAREAGCRHRALGALGSNRQSPENVTPFQSFTRGPGSPLTPPSAMLDKDIYDNNNNFYANPGGDPGDPAGDNPDDNENLFQDDPPEEEPIE